MLTTKLIFEEVSKDIPNIGVTLNSCTIGKQAQDVVEITFTISHHMKEFHIGISFLEPYCFRLLVPIEFIMTGCGVEILSYSCFSSQLLIYRFLSFFKVSSESRLRSRDFLGRGIEPKVSLS